MTTTVIAGVPLEESTIAAFLGDLAKADQPRNAFLDACERYEISVNVGRVVANRAGYPDRRRLARAAEEAQNRARAEHHTPEPVQHRLQADRQPAQASHDDADGSEGRLLDIPLSRIKEDPKNVREELTEISELADSIEEIGLLQPVVVRPSDVAGDDQLILVIGHRRRAAFALLGRETIPAIVRGHMLPDEVLAAMLVENGQRVGLDPIEEARGLNRLKVQGGLVDQSLARKVGRSQAYVSGRLALLSLDKDDQDAVRAGTMSIQNAINKARRVNGTWRPEAKGKASAAHLAFNHRLASAAESVCRQLGHSKMTAGRIGGIACGECWEAVIRSDERNQLARGRQTDRDLRDAVTHLRDEWTVAGRDDVAADLTNLLEGTPS